MPSVFFSSPPPRLKLDSHCRNTSEVRSSKGQRMKKRPPRSASATLTFTQTHTNWQKEEERKEQSVPSGRVTFSPATSQATRTSVCECVRLCAGIYCISVCRGWICFSSKREYYESVPSHVHSFSVNVHVNIIWRYDSVALCSILHDTMCGAIFEVTAVCVGGGAHMHRCVRACVQSWDSARGGLTFPTSLFMTGGNRQPHSNITSWVAWASLGRNGWQTQRRACERQRDGEKMRDLYTWKEKDFMWNVFLFFYALALGCIVLHFHANNTVAII